MLKRVISVGNSLGIRFSSPECGLLGLRKDRVLEFVPVKVLSGDCSGSALPVVLFDLRVVLNG